MKVLIKDFFIKFLIMLILMFAGLMIIDILSITFGIRPQSVIVYLGFGMASGYLGYQVHDKAIKRKDDMLPEYILTKVRENNKKIEIVEEYLEQSGLSKEELEMRSKLREEVERDK